MRVLVSGATGFIGSALAPALEARRDTVVRLRRSRPAGAGAVTWDPATGSIDAQALEGLDAVVHLAGEPIAGRRWTEQHKARVLDSRVRGTAVLAEALADLDHKPSVWVSASAVGYYGDRGDEVLTEERAGGEGFLARVCAQWEEAARPAGEAGIRVVHTRAGLVFSPDGGILPRQMLPFRLFVGGAIGSGTQWVPWVSLEDHLRALLFLLERDDLSGAFNVTAPHPIPNAEFTAILGRVLRRPRFFRIPAVALELALGREMAREMLLVSQRVVPRRLTAAGYEFADRALEPALRRMLARRE